MPGAGTLGALAGLCPLQASKFLPVRAVQSLNKEVPGSQVFPQRVAHYGCFLLSHLRLGIDFQVVV